MKKILFIATFILSTSNVFGLSLTDEQLVIEDKKSITFVEFVEKVTSADKTLISKTGDNYAIHLFKNDDYLSSIEKTTDEYFVFESESFKDESTAYKEAGFDKLPSIHVSNKDKLKYKDQQGTGQYSDYNCGPTSISMAMSWLEMEEIPVDQMRSSITDSPMYVYTDEITDYLDKLDINYSYRMVNGVEDLISPLNNGEILLICFDASKVSYQKGPRIDRFYYNVNGHFAVITGYVKVGDNLYFEVQDPFSMGQKIEGRYKGDTIFYSADGLIKAIKEWWPMALEVDKTTYKED